jgi:hypothetical protein
MKKNLNDPSVGGSGWELVSIQQVPDIISPVKGQMIWVEILRRIKQ